MPHVWLGDGWLRQIRRDLHLPQHQFLGSVAQGVYLIIVRPAGEGRQLVLEVP